MDVKKDELVVTPRQLVTDEKGNHPEAEEAPAARRVEAEASVRAGGETLDGGVPVVFDMPMTAGELAISMRRKCEFCKHFDRPTSQRLIAEADHPAAPMERREKIQQMRAHLIATGNAEVYAASQDEDGTLDVEGALDSLGVCRALTEQENELVFVHPMSCCPPEVCTLSSPQGYFEDREKFDRRGASLYDAILKAADGRPL
jgi:ferredoxin-like protein FixX